MKKDNIRAIILGAGLGTRLRPLTEKMPKPMINICNKPLLENIILKLEAAGIAKFAVNTHYMGESIRKYINASRFADAFKIYNEPEILGTGGPLVNAKDFLSDAECFVLHNGDVLSDIDINALVESHLKSKALATMALIDGPENKVRVAPDGAIIDILNKLQEEAPSMKTLTYSGIAVFSPKIFRYLPAKPINCSIITAIMQAIDSDPGSVRAFIPSAEVYWNDLGSIGQYFKAHEDILLKKLIMPPSVDSSLISDSRIIGEGTIIDDSASVSGFLCAGKKCRIEASAELRNCILLDGATVKSGEYRHNEIIAPEFSRHRHFQTLASLEILKKHKLENCIISSLVEQGSDRGFYRIIDNGRPEVLMLSSELDMDFKRYIDIGRFLYAAKLMTPEIYAENYDEYTVLMEDLGNNTISILMDGVLSEAKIKSLYTKIIDALVEYQLGGTEKLLNSRNAPEIRLFDYEYLRWETSYFKKNFLENYSGISEEKTAALDMEFHELAKLAAAQPYIFMHRDFQSQNVLLFKNKIRFVDFQGSRRGPLAYDIMSLLKDPYVSIPEKTEKALLAYYLKKLKSSGASGILQLADSELDSHYEFYTKVAGLQRVMQALGAYTFLSLKKGKKKYLQYIPKAFAALKTLIAEYNNLPDVKPLKSLAEIISSLRLS